MASLLFAGSLSKICLTSLQSIALSAGLVESTSTPGWMTYPVILLVRENMSNDPVTLAQLDETVKAISVLHKDCMFSLEVPSPLHLSIAVPICKRHKILLLRYIYIYIYIYIYASRVII